MVLSCAEDHRPPVESLLPLATLRFRILIVLKIIALQKFTSQQFPRRQVPFLFERTLTVPFLAFSASSVGLRLELLPSLLKTLAAQLPNSPSQPCHQSRGAIRVLPFRAHPPNFPLFHHLPLARHCHFRLVRRTLSLRQVQGRRSRLTSQEKDVAYTKQEFGLDQNEGSPEFLRAVEARFLWFSTLRPSQCYLTCELPL